MRDLKKDEHLASTPAEGPTPPTCYMCETEGLPTFRNGKWEHHHGDIGTRDCLKPPELLIKCTNCKGYVMFKRVSPSEIEIIHNCEGEWYEEVSALLTKAGIPERESGVEPGSESFISIERRVQMVIDRAADIHIEFCESPCGHSSQYAYSEDGGKNIICLVCELKAAGPKHSPRCPNPNCRGELKDGRDRGEIYCVKCEDCWELSGVESLAAFFTPSAGEQP